MSEEPTIPIARPEA